MELKSLPCLTRIVHPLLLRRRKLFRGRVYFGPGHRRGRPNVSYSRMRSRTSHAMARIDLGHLATKWIKLAG